MFWAVQASYVIAALVFLVINVVVFNLKNVRSVFNLDGAHWSDVCLRSHQPLLLHQIK